MKKLFIFPLLICLILPGCGTETNDMNEESTPAAQNTTIKGWGYRPMTDARPEFTAEQIQDMEKNSCIYMGAPDNGLYLTFDEGYENGYTGQILDVLKEKNVPAAFFITGPYLKSETALVRRMVEEGHIVGNHTNTHPSLPTITDDAALKEELAALDREFYALFEKPMRYLRPPKGEYNSRTLQLTKALGYTNVFWSFAYKDWDTKDQKGAQYAFDKVMSGLHGGAVILLHAVSCDNAAALGSIIDAAREKGFAFRSLDAYVSGN